MFELLMVFCWLEIIVLPLKIWRKNTNKVTAQLENRLKQNEYQFQLRTNNLK